MDARRRSTASPASGSKRSRSPDTVEDAWRLQCKRSAAGSRRVACRYAGAAHVPPKLREFAPGGRWYKEEPPLKPMSGPDFDKWRAEWERHRRAKAAWDAGIGSTSGGGAPLAGEEEEGPLFLKAIEESLKDDTEKKRAEEEDLAAAIAAVKEAQLREAEADAYIVNLSD
ncbi:hypothetical protein QYE76_027259 [Lolium multiflorum]|uniref:Uncharacterized protein n=1 Tax=Lolium multiflorum TaxID=4521 RepID=A0AAD8PH61_LOLMU|nr:hypothetical protein QYE76_027259 [Lolium multiflorum]